MSIKHPKGRDGPAQFAAAGPIFLTVRTGAIRVG